MWIKSNMIAQDFLKRWNNMYIKTLYNKKIYKNIVHHGFIYFYYFKTSLHTTYCLPASFASRMVMISWRIPLSFGREIQVSEAEPMMKTLSERVENSAPEASLTWTISKEPGCLSRLTIAPTRPVLLPRRMITWLPMSALRWPMTLPVAKSILMVSLRLINGSAKRMVRPSVVWLTGITASCATLSWLRP